MDTFTISFPKANSFDVTLGYSDDQNTSLASANITFIVKEDIKDVNPIITKRNTSAGGGDTEVTVYNSTNNAVIHILPTDLISAGEYSASLTIAWPSNTPPLAYTWAGTVYVSDYA